MRVHHRLLRAAVEHLDVEAERGSRGRAPTPCAGPRAPGRCRPRRARACRSSASYVFMRVSASTSSPFGLADERVQHGAGVEALADRASRARRRARTRARGGAGCGSGTRRRAPSPSGEKSARTSRGESTNFPKRGCFGCGRTRIVPPIEVRLVGVVLEHHVGARMVGALGAVDALQVARLVPREDVADRRASRRPCRRAFTSATVCPLPSLLAELGRHRERERNRPRVLLAAVLDVAPRRGRDRRSRDPSGPVSGREARRRRSGRRSRGRRRRRDLRQRRRLRLERPAARSPEPCRRPARRARRAGE